MKRACVVIPIYKAELSAYEQISLAQCVKVLRAYDIYLVIPERLENDIKRFPFVLDHQLRYKMFPDHFFSDIPAYNRLMKFPGFYKMFLDYEFLLIHQLDAFVFSDELDLWCNKGFDNIGAPLFEGYDYASQDSEIISQGNGGFCLRNVKTCFNVVSKFRRLNYRRAFDGERAAAPVRIYRYLKHRILFNFSGYPFQPIINEDLFWAEVIPEAFNNFKVPEPEQAIGFSFEVNPKVLFEKNGRELPFGCHAWWKYDLEFWKKHIEAHGYKL
jgi:hypothetical protein